jgi:long-chain fatty acid transport protein
VFNTLTLAFSNPLTPSEQLVENFRNTSGVRIGGEWAGSNQWTVRAGWDYHQAATPAETVTALLPEGTRNEFTAGLGFNFTKQFRADLAYQYIQQQDRRGRVRGPVPGAVPTAALNSGLYAFHAHLAGITATVRF